MSIRSALEKKIENKTKEINELESKLREEKAFLMGLTEALKVMPREYADERQTEKILRPGSNMEKARDVLRRAKKPLHIVKLLGGMGIENTRSNRSSVSSSINTYAKRGEIFTSHGQNTFGLLEFGDNEEDDEPPDGFGMETEEKDEEERELPF
ncbi:MAG: hypothetical protein ACLGJB_04090 [Blastocatellia bacterium]